MKLATCKEQVYSEHTGATRRALPFAPTSHSGYAARPATDQPLIGVDHRVTILSELNGPSDEVDRVIERVDPAWISAVARLADRHIDAIAGRWVDLVEEDLGFLPREEKPWIRQLAGDIVTFARAADRSQDVLFAWSL